MIGGDGMYEGFFREAGLDWRREIGLLRMYDEEDCGSFETYAHRKKEKRISRQRIVGLVSWKILFADMQGSRNVNTWVLCLVSTFVVIWDLRS